MLSTDTLPGGKIVMSGLFNQHTGHVEGRYFGIAIELPDVIRDDVKEHGLSVINAMAAHRWGWSQLDDAQADGWHFGPSQVWEKHIFIQLMHRWGEAWTLESTKVCNEIVVNTVVDCKEQGSTVNKEGEMAGQESWRESWEFEKLARKMYDKTPKSDEPGKEIVRLLLHNEGLIVEIKPAGPEYDPKNIRPA